MEISQMTEEIKEWDGDQGRKLEGKECLMSVKNRKNKAVYTATKVACGWAGVVMKKAYPSILAGAVTQKPPITPKTDADQPTDRQTNRPTDRLT